MKILSTDTITHEEFIIDASPSWYSPAELKTLQAGGAIRNTFAPRILNQIAA